MGTPRFSSLYEINTRVWLHEIGQRLGRAATLDDVPDRELEAIAGLGFDWVWLLGVWQTGPAGQRVAQDLPELRAEYQRTLDDFSDADVCGSPFAVRAYAVHKDFGGDPALKRFRQRLKTRGLRLVLDFMPNHTALDHPWAFSHPEYYMHGSPALLAEFPWNFTRAATVRGPRVLAYGRDPYFDGWSDTLQLNYRHAGLRRAMISELALVAGRCDGVRCDMAMLILPDVIQQTWGDLSRPADESAPIDDCFWPEAIGRVRATRPDFLFMAEVYWDREWTLQQQGFDATYDKRLYDRLHGLNAPAVRGHLQADPEFQRKSVRFLENHDEPRAAAYFSPAIHRAAAVITFLVPGLRFVHEGEREGRRVRLPVQLRRRPAEPVDAGLSEFYDLLLTCLRRPEVRDGDWRLIECRTAWEGNSTSDRFVAFLWSGRQGELLLAAVNYGDTPGQCYVPVPLDGLRGKQVLLRDLLSTAWYERQGSDLVEPGLYVDLPAWGYHVFEVTAREA